MQTTPRPTRKRKISPERISAIIDSCAGDIDAMVAYDPTKYPSIALTADTALLTVRDGRLAVLLVRRSAFPFSGCWALPGGFCEPDEDTGEAAIRELTEETLVDERALSRAQLHLEQLGTYTTPHRDPRMRVVTVAHVGFAPGLPEGEAGSDAAEVRWWAIEDLADGEAGRLAFDHALIIADAVERARSKIEWTTLATRFVPEVFTMGELRSVYEATWGTQFHRANFNTKVTQSTGFVEPINETKDPDKPGLRASRAYRAGPAERLDPPMRQPELDANDPVRKLRKQGTETLAACEALAKIIQDKRNAR